MRRSCFRVLSLLTKMVVVASTLVLFIFIPLLADGSATSHQKTVYVLPTTPPVGESPSLCPTGHCYTLSEISSRYTLESNTTLVLLPGTHTISARNDSDSAIRIRGVKNFSIIGRKSTSTSGELTVPRIGCINPGTFQIHINSSTGLLLRGFEIKGCSAKENHSYTFASVEIIYSSNITIKVVKVLRGNGVGLHLWNVYQLVNMLDSEFTNNYGENCVISTNQLVDNDNSTAIKTFINLTISNSTFALGKSFFTYLTATGLYIKISTIADRVEIHLVNVTFLENKHYAYYGDFCILLNVSKSSYINIHRLNSTQEHTKKNHCEWDCYDRKGLYLHNLRKGVHIHILNSHFIRTCLSVSGQVQTLYLHEVTFQHAQCERAVLQLHNIANGVLRNIRISNSVSKARLSLEIESSNIAFEGQCSFQENGGAIVAHSNSVLAFSPESNTKLMKNTCSVNNKTQYCSTFEADNSKILVQQNSTIIFKNNIGTSSGGLTLYDSTMNIRHNISITFDSNVGTNGGALALYGGSYLNISPCSNRDFRMCDIGDWFLPTRIIIMFISNHASDKGGAIYADDSWYTKKPLTIQETFYAIYIFGNDNKSLNVSFTNNTAQVAGSAIYGGWFAYAFVYHSKLKTSKLYHFYGMQNDLSVVASNPVRVCMCISSLPNCTISDHKVEIFPGWTLEISVVAVGQQFGTVPSIVNGSLMNTPNKGTLNDGQYVQTVHRHCTTLQYTVFSANKMEKLKLIVDKGSVLDLKDIQENLKQYDADADTYTEVGILIQQLTITVAFKTCPVGFTFNYTLKKCSCHPTLIDHQIYDCDIQTLRILKPSQKWITATFTHTEGINITNGAIAHDHCPFDYCKQNTPHVSLDMDHPDDQCDFNRSGILCGACQTNFSHVFGTSRCKKCSNLWALLLVPAIALLGIALVVLLISLNLTVSIGMTNGLIFYANIVRANHSIFFHSNTFLSKFIAWLNLDLGFEVCFYNGLDAYAKTWLQLLFPVYIWALVLTIIIFSRRYTFAARLSGTNAVQVLATLFLLSYAKLIRTIITILQPTILMYPDGFQRRVWHYDGNVDYLKGKHIPLFIVALLVLVCLSIPYTTSLLFIHWLRKYNHHRLLHWVGKLKPLFDAYTGPLKEKHCYWFGILLLVRVALYTVFSLNTSGDAFVNLLAIGICTTLLLAYLSIIGGVYESRLANVMQSSFLMNLLILTLGSYATYYGSIQTIATASVAIAFCLFACIVMYHAYLRASETRRGKHVIETIKSQTKKLFFSQKVIKDYFSPPVETQQQNLISHSSIELREPLLVCAEDSR